MGLCGGPIFGATFCEQFGLIMTSAARTKRKKCVPKNCNLGGPNERDQNMSCFEGLEMGLSLEVLRPEVDVL